MTALRWQSEGSPNMAPVFNLCLGREARHHHWLGCSSIVWPLLLVCTRSEQTHIVLFHENTGRIKGATANIRRRQYRNRNQARMGMAQLHRTRISPHRSKPLDSTAAAPPAPRSSARIGEIGTSSSCCALMHCSPESYRVRPRASSPRYRSLSHHLVDVSSHMWMPKKHVQFVSLLGPQ